MKLLKFGGTSLANAKKFLCVADIIEKNQINEQIAIVLSAPAKVTNYLVKISENNTNTKQLLEYANLSKNIFIEIIKNIKKIISYFNYEKTKKTIIKEFNELKKIIDNIISLKKCPESTKAIIISRGEILSICIMKNILQSLNHQVTIINPVKNLVSIGSYLNSIVNINESKKNIKKININNNDIILMPGFIAGNKKNEVVVLGRNGSDYSAAILAVCLKARICEIWTDVDGVFTSDPKKIFNTSLLKSISYEEARELSYFGAKVLHPRTIEPLENFNIPCVIKNTSNIKSKGTLICKTKNLNKTSLKGVTNLDNVTMYTISGSILKKTNNIFIRINKILTEKSINIILITQSSSKNNFSFCTFKKDQEKILSLFKQEFKLELENKLLDNMNINNNISILSVIGLNIYKKNNIISKIFSALNHPNINIFSIAQGSSKHSISIVIDKKNIFKNLQNVHNILFYNKKIINVFLIGAGGVGKALIKQILKQKKFLHNKNIEIKINAIANSKKILFSDNFIDLKNWEKNLQESTNKFNLEILNQLLKNNNFLNSVLIDCTADENLSKQYTNFLSLGLNVVTSNKKANTNSLEYYNNIRRTMLKTNKKFLYETNVGAGLPVIQTLQNLFNTGDNLICFQGILSGSLSFIFGRLEEGILLSKAIEEAKQLGFTEPNPYDDLSGIDVARKLLILAREIGYSIELKDIQIEPILPDFFKKYQDTKELLNKIKKIDCKFNQIVKKAKSLGNVLRFVGTIEKKGKCSVKIKQIHKKHPLYKVKNGENALTFYTNYYQPIPLVLRGYGAGNNVTASGVFSDLLRIIL
ncbi:Bifunctional aspartokinase/homoserine dehydrogenase 1 [Buchnera aphidicola (Protaphis terricola)]|uniref:bifunctional aspartate kinase/homoserine dehydrogenase I n=1 Tax=Buchnera aphidicola TaxID=9 RepID=UPI003464DA1C